MSVLLPALGRPTRATSAMSLSSRSSQRSSPISPCSANDRARPAVTRLDVELGLVDEPGHRSRAYRRALTHPWRARLGRSSRASSAHRRRGSWWTSEFCTAKKRYKRQIRVTRHRGRATRGDPPPALCFLVDLGVLYCQKARQTADPCDTTTCAGGSGK